MPRALTPKGGNDRVYTPPELARDIVEYFQPKGLVLEPCAGVRRPQAFVDAAMRLPLVDQVVTFEIDEGRDFLDQNGPRVRVDWVITNPPWSKLQAFLLKSMEVAGNVVFLCLVPAFFQKSKQRAMREARFGIKEILFVPTPPKPWPQTGFCLGAVHIQRGYDGPVSLSNLYGNEF